MRETLARLCVLLIIFAACQGGAGEVRAADVTFPPLTGRIVDQANLISPAAEAELEAQLAAHESATGQQVVVATVPSLEGMEIQTYGTALGRAWGIGQAGKNTGAILLVAPQERQVRIEVGYGLEGELTDAASRVIIEREILPAFRSGNMEDGVVAGARAILRLLRGEVAPGVAPERTATPADRESLPVGFVLLIIFLFLITRGRGRRRRGLGGLLPLILLGGSGGRSGSGFGGGGFRGGGGGFRGGGGSFGGGGASGRW